jgi:superfamily II DNA/RNA helicase
VYILLLSLCVYNRIDITTPTPVQQIVIPMLLKRENVMLAAATGSGKTLAYTLPVMQLMHWQEHGLNTVKKDDDESLYAPYIRVPKKPRCLGMKQH